MLAEELLTVLPAMLQEHLDQEQNSMRAAEQEAEKPLRVLEEILLVEGLGI